jgi:hypothetical protein
VKKQRNGKTLARVAKEIRLGSQVQFRMNEDLSRRVNGYRANLSRELGIEVTFSTAVRSLIERGLKVV